MPKKPRPRPQIVERTKLPDGSVEEVVKSWDDAFDGRPEFEQWLTEALYLTNDVISKESDRAAAVLAPAFLDAILEDLLRAFLREAESTERLLGIDEPIGTFSSRISLVHALGLISDRAYRDLNLIRKIRNDFAHGLATHTFEHPDIKNRCQALSVATRWKDWDFTKLGAAREAFLRAVFTSVAEISNGRRYARRRVVVPPIEKPDEEWLGY